MGREWPKRLARLVADRSADRSTLTAVVSRDSLALAGVAVLAGLGVYVVATTLFPHHSINHDEGVYLQQAAMLLDGKLWLEPPVPEAVRPWFFVQEGGRLYPKYEPVAAALYAPGLALGAPRVVLALVATASVLLVGLLAREAFDPRAAPLAAVLFASAPLFLLSSSVFLAYAPTTLCNLLFALAYVRTLRRGSRRYAVLAGLAVGVAFLSRPYTAVLFALPFVGHATVVLVGRWRERVTSSASGSGSDRSRALTDMTARLLTVAALGGGFVGLSLSYNWLLTGDPLVFPYEAFAPADGVGFGQRRILAHELVYTPELALRSNGLVLWTFLSQWGPLGPLGTVLGAVGLTVGLVVPLWRRSRGDGAAGTGGPLPDLTLRGVLAGVAVTVPVGNVFFWGNRNVLADLSDPTDGLVAYLGPFYHFDLLVPVAVFGAAGLLALADRAGPVVDGVSRRLAGGDGRRVRTLLVATLLVTSLVVAGGIEAAALGGPVGRNADYRDEVGPVYEPFETTTFENALVFVPTPYGDWLGHPFQRLRNDPALSGPVVYALDRDATGDAASLAAFEGRQPYRFTYRGDWPPDDDGVTPVLEPLAVRAGDRLAVTTRTGVVAGAQSATVRLATENASVLYGVDRVDRETTTLRWILADGSARLDDDRLRRFSDEATVPLDGPTELTLSVTYTQAGGATVTYRQTLTVVGTDDGVRALWPPEERVCRLTSDCGREGTYVDGADYPAGVSLSSTVRSSNTSEAPNASGG